MLESVQLPIVMLSNDMRIRHFTPLATKLFNMIETDVGRPLSNIKANVDIPDMETHVLKVMDSITPDFSEVRDSNDAVAQLDFAGNIQAWNRAAEKIFGFSKTEALNIYSLIRDGTAIKVRVTWTALVDTQDKPYVIVSTERLQDGKNI